MKTVVIYYSQKGSNAYLANKIANELQCDIEKIQPRLSGFLFIMLGIHAGIKPIKTDLTQYKNIILVGPVYVGRLIYPLKSFIKRYRNKGLQWFFVTCCGSSFEEKNDKFGHARVFEKVQKLIGDKCKVCQAFPIGMVLTEDQKQASEAVMQTRLNDETFKGSIAELFDKKIDEIRKIV